MWARCRMPPCRENGSTEGAHAAEPAQPRALSQRNRSGAVPPASFRRNGRPSQPACSTGPAVGPVRREPYAAPGPVCCPLEAPAGAGLPPAGALCRLSMSAWRKGRRPHPLTAGMDRPGAGVKPLADAGCRRAREVGRPKRMPWRREDVRLTPSSLRQGASVFIAGSRVPMAEVAACPRDGTGVRRSPGGAVQAGPSAQPRPGRLTGEARLTTGSRPAGSPPPRPTAARGRGAPLGGAPPVSRSGSSAEGFSRGRLPRGGHAQVQTTLETKPTSRGDVASRPAENAGGRGWVRTSDPCGVNTVLYH